MTDLKYGTGIAYVLYLGLLIRITRMASKERMRNYKNKAKDQEELRRKREEEGIQLRKQKRDEQVV